MSKPKECPTVTALRRLSLAVEGLDSLRDDDSRAEAYAEELKELAAAQEQARTALQAADL